MSTSPAPEEGPSAIDALRWLAHPERLGAQLERATRGRTQGHVCAALFCDDAHAFVKVERSAPYVQSDGSDRITIGCLAKGLTATLVAQAVAEDLFSLDTPVTAILASARECYAPVLSGITLRHLLNHTHGLDASAIRDAPLTAAGTIDLPVLCAVASRMPRLSNPGNLYSYGNTGMWLAAGILEHLRAKPYEQLLYALLRSLGVEPRRDLTYRQPVCPSQGNCLSLSLGETVEITRQLVSGALAHGLLPGEAAPLPGWAHEKGSALGWKSFGDGWFGHNALLPYSSAVVRFHMSERIGIVVSASDRAAAPILARLFGRLLPEFRDMQIPRALAGEQAALAALRVRAGTYADGASRAVVTTPAGNLPMLSLQVLGEDGSPCGPEIRTSLKPCTLDTFMLEPCAAAFGSWVQFLELPPAGEYLWNGKKVMRRYDVECHV